MERLNAPEAVPIEAPAMRLYGHRGARGEAPENTLAGFRRCVEAGARRAELDIRISRDHELVVIHDETLRRTTGVRARVSSLDASHLATLDARRNTPACASRQGIPKLAEVLELCPEISHFQLEAKSPRRELFEATVQAITGLFRSRELRERATLTSFDARLLDRLRALEPAIPLGLVCDKPRPDPVAGALALRAGLLVLDWKLCTADRVRQAHAAGLEVSVWTVNTEALALRLQALGVDSIVTDYPTRMVELFDGGPGQQ